MWSIGKFEEQWKDFLSPRKSSSNKEGIGNEKMHEILSHVYGMIRQINYGEILYGMIMESMMERF